MTTLANQRITFKSYDNGQTDHVTDDWRISVPADDSRDWTGTTLFFTSEPEKVGGDSESSGSSSSGTRPASVDMSYSKTWDGIEPPISIYVDGTVFIRRKDGIWCRRDTRGRLYPVNRNGERCARPKEFEASRGAYHEQRRPRETSPHIWWK